MVAQGLLISLQMLAHSISRTMVSGRVHMRPCPQKTQYGHIEGKGPLVADPKPKTTGVERTRNFFFYSLRF